MSLFTTNSLMKEVLSIIRSGLLFQNDVMPSGKSWWKSAGVLILQLDQPSQISKLDFATCQLYFLKGDITLAIDEASYTFPCTLMNANTKKDVMFLTLLYRKETVV